MFDKSYNILINISDDTPVLHNLKTNHNTILKLYSNCQASQPKDQKVNKITYQRCKRRRNTLIVSI